MLEASPAEWEIFLASYPEAHILQTRAWGDLKAAFGWKAVYLISEAAGQDRGAIGAQVLFKALPLGWSAAYIAKGPVGCQATNWNSPEATRFWRDVDSLCQKERAIFLKVEPDFWESKSQAKSAPGPAQDPVPAGFRPSPQSIQPNRTLVVNLLESEDLVLGRMKQKTRYNIRLGLKKGIVVRQSADLEGFHRLLEVTGERDFFGVHSQEYYQHAYDLFHPRGECELLVAEFESQPLAALMVFARGSRAWYFYGASSSEHRERMPTYLLQWEAMRWARRQGCTTYDLWGVPDEDEQTLEADFTRRSGGLWGVYRFKRGFGGELLRAAGPWDRVYQPAIYRFYSLWSRYRSRD